MFKRKPTSPVPPPPLSFNDILSDLTRLQAYNKQALGEKINILEIINTDNNNENNENNKPEGSTGTSSIPSETLDATYDQCTNFIRVNNQLLVSRRDLDGLGLDIERLRKELSGMIETLNDNNDKIY